MVVPEVAASFDEAVQAASRIGFPVVLKVLSPDVSHKSDVGGVELNLADETAVRDTLGVVLKHHYDQVKAVQQLKLAPPA